MYFLPWRAKSGRTDTLGPPLTLLRDAQDAPSCVQAARCRVAALSGEQEGGRRGQIFTKSLPKSLLGFNTRRLLWKLHRPRKGTGTSHSGGRVHVPVFVRTAHQIDCWRNQPFHQLRIAARLPPFMFKTVACSWLPPPFNGLRGLKLCRSLVPIQRDPYEGQSSVWQR